MSHKEGGGVTLKSVTGFMENFAPKIQAESWDNTGLLIEPTTQEPVKTILLTNDLTEKVMKEAVTARANLIISYHPPIFKSLTNITTATWKGRIIAACLENKIAVYSPHTRWDTIANGVSDWLASGFDYETISPIDKTTSAGRYIELKQEMTLSQAVNNVKNLTRQPHVQIAIADGATLETKIQSIAVCAGSGSSVLQNNPAQLYVTGEMSHHSLLDAVHSGSSVIVCNHSNSERGFLKVFQKIIEEKFTNDVNVIISKEDKDPLQFV